LFITELVGGYIVGQIGLAISAAVPEVITRNGVGGKATRPSVGTLTGVNYHR
jgi:hypothetical protein